jgi:SAM-dependent methyltransferase
LPWAERTFDVLVMSEVLEHLVDPWAALRKLRPLLKPGARVFASSPNAGHHSVIRMLLAGRWDLDDAGVMDRTHLRWFTPGAYRAMFESAGYEVVLVRPLRRLGMKGRMISTLSAGRAEHLLHRQIYPRSAGGRNGIDDDYAIERDSQRRRRGGPEPVLRVRRVRGGRSRAGADDRYGRRAASGVVGRG